MHTNTPTEAISLTRCHTLSANRDIKPGLTYLDPTLRPHHMRQLYELAKAPTKIWKPLPGGDHNSSVLEEGYFEAIADFISAITGEEKRLARQNS
jgi:hypothetical protein